MSNIISKEENNRLKQFDFMRGIAIFYIVLYHVILKLQEKLSVSLFLNGIVQILYIVQLPIFFFISGFFLPATLNKNSESFNYKAYIIKKAKALLIPYISCSLLILIVDTILNKKNPELLSTKFTASKWLYNFIRGSGDYISQYWFLYVLFILFLIFPLIYYIVEKIGTLKSMTILFFVSIISGTLIKENIIYGYFISLVKALYYLFYFYLGFSFHCKFELNAKKVRKMFTIISLFLVSICYIYFNYLKTDFFSVAFSIMIASLNVYFLFVISDFLVKKYNFTFINYLGVRSMDVYLFHTPYFILGSIYIFMKFKLSINIILALTIIISIVGPLLMCRLLTQFIPFFDTLFLGRKAVSIESINISKGGNVNE